VRWGWWLAATGFVVAFVLLCTPFSRALDYDEAVFVSQSGGLEGTHTPHWFLVATREHGTPALIALVRHLSSDLGSLELLWAGLMLVLVLAAFMLTSRIIGSRAAIIGFLVFSTYWISTVFFSAFFGSLGGAAGALATTSLYLWMRAASRRRVLIGLAFGLAAAGMSWMRILEPVVVLAVIVVHALVWRPSVVLRRWRAALAAVAAYVLAFAVPWLVLTIHRWGSLSGWWHAARQQGKTKGRTGHPFGLHNGFEPYWHMMTGRGGHYSIIGGTPLVVWLPTAILLTAMFALTVTVAVRALSASVRSPQQVDNRERHGAALLYFAQFVAGLGMFLFVQGDLRERYTLFGVMFAAVVVGIGIDALVRRFGRRLVAADDRRRWRRPAVLAATLLLAAAWLVPQAWVARAVQHSRSAKAGVEARFATVLRVIAAGRPCVALDLARRPGVQLVSGCIGHQGHYEPAPGAPGRSEITSKWWTQGYVTFVLVDTKHPPLLDMSDPAWQQLHHVWPNRPSWVLYYRPAT
jgi:hypothetical protein